mmetsp:Transcript_13376/g.35957  ORF Transcript_13376/g.35957 Transcript_13376/m.35957 type:complete len:390 (-) Transcript_13376:704-1873(-)
MNADRALRDVLDEFRDVDLSRIDSSFVRDAMSGIPPNVSNSGNGPGDDPDALFTFPRGLSQLVGGVPAETHHVAAPVGDGFSFGRGESNVDMIPRGLSRMLEDSLRIDPDATDMAPRGLSRLIDGGMMFSDIIADTPEFAADAKVAGSTNDGYSPRAGFAPYVPPSLSAGILASARMSGAAGNSARKRVEFGTNVVYDNEQAQQLVGSAKLEPHAMHSLYEGGSRSRVEQQVKGSPDVEHQSSLDDDDYGAGDGVDGDADSFEDEGEGEGEGERAAGGTASAGRGSSHNHRSGGPTPMSRAGISKLTPEERKRRRAESNRLSAERSRERRKSFLMGLELGIKNLEDENRQLRERAEASLVQMRLLHEVAMSSGTSEQRAEASRLVRDHL